MVDAQVCKGTSLTDGWTFQLI